MTSEEIKQSVLMSDVVRSYGITIRNGMCSCPFHGKDKHPSMKIYKDSYYCFTCASNGDVFTFVQQMEQCDFPTAFLKLGGEYEHKKVSFRAKRVAEMKRNQKKTESENNQKKENDIRSVMAFNLESIRTLINECEPLSDDWCFAQEMLPIVEEHWEQQYIREEEAIKADVFRLHRRIRQRFPDLR